MKRATHFAILLLPLLALADEESAVSPELKPFVEQDATVIAIEHGDVNADGRSDVLLVLENQGIRILKIVARQKDGALKLIGRNEHIILCSICGGSSGGFELTAGRGFFEIEDSVGMHSCLGLKRFRFKCSRSNACVLATVVEQQYCDGEKSKSVRTSKDFGAITFQNFNAEDFDVNTEGA